MKGGGLNTFSDGAIDALVAAAEGLPSAYSQIFLVPVHGAATRVGASETAFSFREAHFEFLHSASWDANAADEHLPAGEKHVQWTRQSWQALSHLRASVPTSTF